MEERLECGGVKKFVVLKEEYVERLSPRLKSAVNEAALCVSVERAADGKEPCPEYVVINTDEPYIGEIIEVLKKHDAWG